MFTEREAIKQRLKEIQEEKDRLSKETLFLLNRIRELDNVERQIELPTDVNPLDEDSKEQIWKDIQQMIESSPPIQSILNEMPPKEKNTGTNLATTSFQEERSIEEVHQQIKSFLMERREPVTRKEMKEMLKGNGLLKWASVDYVMKKVMSVDRNIRKVGRGLFEYAPPSSDEV
ncbi:hypothetical protein [Halalkalibacterium halodurans]|uniref:Rok-like winged helix domain-containing protein n=1 Tax=Halalkalibacterium halodurans TaxID=86665 RepID=UPI002E239BF3|nr:hypothetical protein [Halalkalibacterium halodurans]